ncbi:hypothetical protein M758_10G002000 [Ceratodon purpureus]|uniref:Uncharacterized protein n=1 Tax=Ceratodon purpureus TaxID=3225 RepID=A0A8T0GLZ6_CERPU|nr:hypothetical protein KC19_10G001900 [Ceratodon purpureus]KAG0602249.1 hypothetical protein M758_10G002000 [Ceratodon purpureus]
MSGRKALAAALRASTRRLALPSPLEQARSFSSSLANGGGGLRSLPNTERAMATSLSSQGMSPKEMGVRSAAIGMFDGKRAMSSSKGKTGAKGTGQADSGDEMDVPSENMFGNSAATGSFREPHPVDLPMDDFELRVLGISSKKDDGEDDDLLRELEEIERSASWRAAGAAEGESGGDDSDLQEDEDDEEWEDERGQVLSDAALSAIVDYDLDDEQRPYQFRPDRLFFPGQTYDPEDLDLSKKPDELERPPPRYRRRYDNNEVLQRADFRNPRYLSNFIAETSRILPKRRVRFLESTLS